MAALSDRTERTDPVDLGAPFVEIARHRPLQLVSPGFEQVDRPAETVEGPQEVEARARAPFLAIEVAVPGPVRRGTAPPLRIGLTTADDSAEQVALAAWWDPARERLGLEIVSQGRRESIRTRRLPTPRDGLRISLVLAENRATVLVAEGDEGPWRPVISERAAVRSRLDFRDPPLLERLRFTWGPRGPVSEPIALGPVRAGVLGMVGLRDPHVVQHADGSPYTVDGRVLMTWTCAGPGGFRQAHWGVFSLDPMAPTDLRQEAHLFFRRDGRVVGDHAGQLVRDGDRWLVLASSWGDFDDRRGNIRAHLTSTTADLLSGVHVLEPTPLVLPTEHATWDPGLTRIDGSWWLSFVESPAQTPFRFHPALAIRAVDPHADDAVLASGWELAGADPTQRQTEGPVLTDLDGRWLVLASDGRGRSYPAYDLTMSKVGELPAPYPTNIPHPVTLLRDDGTRLLLTFDGTVPSPRWREILGYGGHGDVVILSR